MTSVTLNRGIGGMAVSTHPTTAYGNGQARLRLDASAAFAYIQFGLPAAFRSPGIVVASATLIVTQSGAWPSGTHTMTGRRIADAWNVARLTWNNRPTVAGSDRSVTQAAGPDGTSWSMDVTADVQAWANGTPNYGMRVQLTDDALYPINGFTATLGAPVLVLNYYIAPLAPTFLAPSFGAVSTATPTLAWVQDSDVTSFQVQIDPAGSPDGPQFDSGEILSVTPDTTDSSTYVAHNSLDLSTTTYPGLSNGSTTQWRVRVKNPAGNWSPWADWATFNRVNKPTLTIDSPSSVVLEPTPPFASTMAGMTKFQWFIADAANPSVHLYDSGIIKGTDGDITPQIIYDPMQNTDIGPGYFRDDSLTYRVTVRAWDGVNREATPGDPPFIAASIDVTIDYDTTITPCTWVDASQRTTAPWVDLTWGRTAMPDGWAIFRNDVQIFHTADAESLLIGGTGVYTWRDWTVAPNRLTTYRVEPCVNGKCAKGGKIDQIVPNCSGIWLIDPNTGLRVVLYSVGDIDPGTWANGEDATTYIPIGAKTSVRVTTGIRGLEGSLSGQLLDTPDFSLDSMEANLLTVKESPTQAYRLAVGDINIPVYVYGITLWPHVATNIFQRAINATFSFTQSGELPFDVVL